MQVSGQEAQVDANAPTRYLQMIKDNHADSPLNNLRTYRIQVLLLSNRRGCKRLLFRMYEACPASKDTKVSNMYNIFHLQKRHCQ